MSKPSDILESTVTEFVSATARKQPTPGGGSVAGVVGSLAVALGEMSLHYTRGKKRFAEHEEFYAHLAERLTRARKMFLVFVAEDITAYGMYDEATGQPDGADKDGAVALALAAAINVPREAAKLALAVLGDLKSLAGRCNEWLVSDLLAAATLAAAVVDMCDFNVRINVRQLTDQTAADDLRTASAEDRRTAAELTSQIEKQVEQYL
jgi:formiminotetrahydrofolate cyclodeaminase